MANERLYNPATRFLLAYPEAFADWQNPTVAELNANPDNDLTGKIFDITCALNQDDTTFDLGDSETDDSLTFCQVAGNANPTSMNPDIVFGIERSRDPLEDNTANVAFGLLAWKGVEYFAILSVGEEPGTEFAERHRVKMARVAVDNPVDLIGTGENIRLQQTFAQRGDVLWNAILES